MSATELGGALALVVGAPLALALGGWLGWAQSHPEHVAGQLGGFPVPDLSASTPRTPPAGRLADVDRARVDWATP